MPIYKRTHILPQSAKPLKSVKNVKLKGSIDQKY